MSSSMARVPSTSRARKLAIRRLPASAEGVARCRAFVVARVEAVALTWSRSFKSATPVSSGLLDGLIEQRFFQGASFSGSANRKRHFRKLKWGGDLVAEKPCHALRSRRERHPDRRCFCQDFDFSGGGNIAVALVHPFKSEQVFFRSHLVDQGGDDSIPDICGDVLEA